MRAGEQGRIRSLRRCTGQRGFTFVWVLMALAVFSVGLAVIGPRWADDARRERERELLRIGNLYAQAIAAFHAATPGSIKSYPTKLDNLVIDRMLSTVRYL